MDFILKKVNETLRLYEKELHYLQEMLKNLPDGQLFMRTIPASVHSESDESDEPKKRPCLLYTDKDTGKKKQRFLTAADNLLFLQLHQKNVIKKLIPICQKNIHHLNKCLSSLQPVDHDLLTFDAFDSENVKISPDRPDCPAAALLRLRFRKTEKTRFRDTICSTSRMTGFGLHWASVKIHIAQRI